MPELPEVEIIRQELEPALHNCSIIKCTLNSPALRYPFSPDFAATLQGAKITATGRRGKYLQISLDNDYVLVWHLGMSGRVKIFALENLYTPEKHDHVHLALSGGGQVVYNDARRFGFMSLHRTDALAQCPPFGAMGPEPLGNHFSGTALHNALAQKKTPIKSALLDQGIVAGIGNIYACEALNDAAIHPGRPALSLSAQECETLARAIRDVLQKALAAGGSSLKDYRKTDGSLGYFQHMFSVYDRAGHPCPRCAEEGGKERPIQRMVQSGRSTFYCLHCQK